ncbi:MAG TPA: beta-galactosidase GalB [Flavisolibacter sp.]|jgi:beta-galactosidase|nr:beta-galactosidase GalB [Flavisolibacter sp.]
MKKFFFTVVSILSLCGIVAAQHKSRVSFNERWKFKLDSVQSYSDAAVNDASWRTLNLPHDWSIEGKFDKNNPAGTGGGALPGGIGWYRKAFTIPLTQKSKSIFIEFDGIYRNGEVFINGHRVGIRPYGYSSFHYDLTPYLKYGNEKNLIAVKVDNSKQPNSRWYSGSGIYRNVWLTTLNKSHIDHWGTYVTTPSISKSEAVVNIETKISNSDENDLFLITSIYDEAGHKIASSTNKVKGNNVAGKINILHPKLWTLERPYLYKVVSQLKSGANLLDEYITPFGIRSFNFDREKGFSLNGKPVKLLGVCDHHDLGALGSAINTRAIERQLQILKAMGCNSIRTSHNPPAPELLDLCDKMGFVVMDEAFDMWAKPKTKYDYHLDWKDWHERDLRDFIMRDRNHPSVMIWSIGNEIPEQWGDEKKGDTSGRLIARELAGIVRSLDAARPITTANNNPTKSNFIIQSGALDLIGYNYSHNKWKNFLQDFPGQKMIVTESTSALETRGHYDLVPFDTIRRWPKRWDEDFKQGNPDLTVSAYDQVSAPWGSTHEESLKPLLKYDHVSGMYIWTGFDYIGEPTPYPWPARSSYFGIIDLAGFPKDVYYLYQSVFINKPVLHIYPHWNWKEGDMVDVIAYYNNADEVELFLNGKSLGKQAKKGDDLHVKWTVPFTPGTLKVISYKNGKTVLTKEVKTAGTPYKLVLKADRNIINSDGKDLSFVEVNVVDKNGVLVPNANNLIKFSLSGQGSIAGVDSGDPVSLESFKSNQHTALNGKALCIVQSNGKKGTITLTATAEGLQSSSASITAK